MFRVIFVAMNSKELMRMNNWNPFGLITIFLISNLWVIIIIILWTIESFQYQRAGFLRWQNNEVSTMEFLDNIINNNGISTVLVVFLKNLVSSFVRTRGGARKSDKSTCFKRSPYSANQMPGNDDLLKHTYYLV